MLLVAANEMYSKSTASVGKRSVPEGQDRVKSIRA